MGARRKPTVIDPAHKELLEQIGKEVVDGLNGRFFEVDGTPLANVKYADKSFKRKTLMAGWEFSLAYAYVGARGLLIFGLTPEDAQEYEFAEMNVKDLDNYFPLIGGDVAKLFGREDENLASVLDQVVTARANAQAEQIEKEKKEAAANYDSNPIFGMF